MSRVERRANWRKKVDEQRSFRMLNPFRLKNLIVTLCVLLCFYGIMSIDGDTRGDLIYGQDKICVKETFPGKSISYEHRNMYTKLLVGSCSQMNTEILLTAEQMKVDANDGMCMHLLWEHQNYKGEPSNITSKKDFIALGDDWKSAFNEVGFTTSNIRCS